MKIFLFFPKQKNKKTKKQKVKKSKSSRVNLMRVLLISRQTAVAFRQALCEDDAIWAPVCVNHPMEAQFYLDATKEAFDYVVLIEQDNMQQEVGGFVRYVQNLENRNSLIQILLFTRNRELFESINTCELRNCITYFVDDIKISPSMVLDGLKKMVKDNEVKAKGFGRLFKNSKKDESDEYILNKSKLLRNNLLSSSKVIGFSGYSGAGTTSTAANIAYLASVIGIKTVLLDLDFEKRGQNIYYAKFGQEVDANRLIEDSILRNLKRPDDFEKNSCRINENLFVSTLSYSFELPQKTGNKLITENALALFFHVLKERANLVVLDVPLSSLEKFEGLSSYVDRFGFCVNNTLYSLISSANVLSNMPKQDALFFRKMSLVGTKFNLESTYNGKPFSLDICLELFESMMEKTDHGFDVRGSINFLAEFDKLLDSQKRLISYSKNIKKDYIDLLEGILV